MIISDFLSMLDLHNWVKGLTVSSSINFDGKSSYFEADDINGYKNIDCMVNLNMVTYCNYVYNYFHFVQRYIKKFEPGFSFNDYVNIYEIKHHYKDINSIEAQIFLESVMEEGLENIKSFFDDLNTYDYDEDIFYLFKYYNFLIEDAMEHNHISQDVFLIEGMIEPFRKADNFLAFKKYINIEYCTNMNINISFNVVDSSEWVIPLGGKNKFLTENDGEKPAEKQALLI